MRRSGESRRAAARDARDEMNAVGAQALGVQRDLQPGAERARARDEVALRESCALAWRPPRHPCDDERGRETEVALPRTLTFGAACCTQCGLRVAAATTAMAARVAVRIFLAAWTKVYRFLRLDSCPRGPQPGRRRRRG